jgi:hypothetical protein
LAIHGRKRYDRFKRYKLSAVPSSGLFGQLDKELQELECDKAISGNLRLDPVLMAGQQSKQISGSMRSLAARARIFVSTMPGAPLDASNFSTRFLNPQSMRHLATRI